MQAEDYDLINQFVVRTFALSPQAQGGNYAINPITKNSFTNEELFEQMALGFRAMRWSIVHKMENPSAPDLPIDRHERESLAQTAEGEQLMVCLHAESLASCGFADDHPGYREHCSGLLALPTLHPRIEKHRAVLEAQITPKPLAGMTRYGIWERPPEF